MGSEEKRVKDIMAQIDEYRTIDADAPLCDALHHLKQYHETTACDSKAPCHKTMLVTDASGNYIGKLSFYDFIRGLVPEPAKHVEVSRKFYSMLTSRALEAAEEVSAMKNRFDWLHNTFSDLVENEKQKKVRDVMAPLHPLLEENDTINKAIFVMFKENIRQPAVVRDGKIVGIVTLMTIFPILMQVMGDACPMPGSQ